MAKVGERLSGGMPAPVAGIYGCTEAGCTAAFKATIDGVPLPPPHHAGAGWKLLEARGGAAPRPTGQGT
jgi:hypothetical protein